MQNKRKGKKLSRAYFQNPDTLFLARDLLGKVLYTSIDGQLTGGVIIETEGYLGIDDRASHAYGKRRTKRNEALYQSGGVAYVYLCYGLHSLLNIVTSDENVPHGILIRAIKPREGLEVMLKRRKKNKLEKSLVSGPGALTQALGISTQHNLTDLSGSLIWVEDQGLVVPHEKILVSPRIGIDYAGEDAFKPWRFLVKGEEIA